MLSWPCLTVEGEEEKKKTRKKQKERAKMRKIGAC